MRRSGVVDAKFVGDTLEESFTPARAARQKAEGQ